MKAATLSSVVGLLVSTASGSRCPCGKLAKALPQKVSFPGDATYNITEAGYWSLLEAHLQPSCIVRPTASQDVADAISIITSVKGCEFAIKSQGHSPAPGSANVQDGVTIDLASLNHTKVSSHQSVVTVGSGASWLDVYRSLEPLGRATLGGRNGLVGVGGLLLGGGISHFSGRRGWACDGVVDFEVVLANGSITHANPHENLDLYRALRGGSNNFGVVTDFSLDTFKQDNLSVNSIVNDVSQRHAVFDAFTDITTSPTFDPNTSLVTAFLYNSTSKTWILSNSAVYTKPEQNPAVFQKLAAVPSLKQTKSIISVAEFADEKPTPPLHWLFGTATFKPSSKLMSELFDVLNSTIYSFNPPGGMIWSVAFEPLVGALLTEQSKDMNDVLGVVPGNNGFIVLISAGWPSGTASKDVQSVARLATSRVEAHAKARGLLQDFQYLNYAAQYQTPLKSYGKENYKFLKEVSRKYDPKGVFQKRVKGGFKLA